LTLLLRGPVELLEDDALCPLADAVYARVRQQPSSQRYVDRRIISLLVSTCLLAARMRVSATIPAANEPSPYDWHTRLQARRHHLVNRPAPSISAPTSWRPPVPLPPTNPVPALNQFALPVLAGLQIKAPQQPLHASPCLEPCTHSCALIP
jgi:hypothetical protein